VRHRIVITGCIGFGNTGDEAIAQAVIGQLREAIDGVRITVISGDPAHTAAAYGVEAVDWRDPAAIADAVRAAGLTIIGGGGLFQDYWGCDPDTMLTREHWGLSFYTAPAVLSAIYGKPLMLYAVGVGPLGSEEGRRLTRLAGDIARRITVRDPASKALLETLGVAAGKITVTADPAFDLTPAPADGIPQVREWTSSRPAIAVALRNWTFGADPDACERRIREVLDSVLESAGGRILFLPFHRAAGLPDESAAQYHDDVSVARRLCAELRHAGRAAVLSEPCSPATMAGIVARADLVLGMRLHSVIFSVAAGVPFVALEYDPKIGGLASCAGFEEFTLPFGGFESQVLAERMRRALDRGKDDRERARGAADDLRRRARENAAIAAGLLREPPADTNYSAETRAVVGQLLRTQLQQAARFRAQFEDASAQLELARQAAVESRRELEDAARARRQLELANSQAARALLEAGIEAEAARARERDVAAQLDLAARSAASLQEQIARLESRSLAGISKRALQLLLDACQLVTPAPLRAAVRKYYLNWFYFKIYPERRAGR
jgi:polysaccharide pyruvyl transferase CsaB